MDRRTFISVALGAAVAAPRNSRAQQPQRVYRVGILRPTAPVPPPELAAAILADLREFGYIQGQNLVVDQRFADGKTERLPALARELVEQRMDVIVAVGAGAIRAARGASTTIPIIMFGNFDPVAAGLVTSLSRPGGNITGILIAADGTLAAKKLELLKEAVPKAERIAVLIPDDPSIRGQVQEVSKAASTLGIALPVVEVKGGDYETAFAAIARERPQALFVAATTFFVRDRKPIIALAAKYKLPAIYEWPEHVQDGGLMAYGTSLPGLYRRIAVYIDRILKGANPGDMPIEQPTKFELVINLGTAKSLGLVLPPSLLLRADTVIQ